MHPSASTARDARNALVSKTYRSLLGAAAVVVALDQLTKELALRTLSDGAVEVIPSVLEFDLHFNPGGAFGIGRDFPQVFLVATLLVAGVILWWARDLEHRSWAIPLGMILGGGIGNVIDRVLRDTDGRVVDFIDFQVWPVFNIADSSIVIGTGLLLWLSRRAERTNPDETP